MAFVGLWNPTGKKIERIPDPEFRRRARIKMIKISLGSIVLSAFATLALLVIPD